MANDLLNVWHQGELAVQQKAGTDKRMAEIGGKFIREFMPQQHRDFFQSLSMIFIGYSDYYSGINAGIFFGALNFIQSPSASELVINTQYSLGNMSKEDLNVGDRVGLLGIEFNTKRRNRINGIITDISQKSIRIKVLQSYGNCPKYIQTKTFIGNVDYGEFTSTIATQLNDTHRAIISNADTFFIASSFNDGQNLNNRGADISHRGGDSGFVTINAQGQLLVDDYRGNGFFNTLGNLFNNPSACLLFCDWHRGHAIQINVTSETIWNADNEDEDEGTTGAERTLCFTPIKVTFLMNALAQRQKEDEII